jgi:hypothetical protein
MQAWWGVPEVGGRIRRTAARSRSVVLRRSLSDQRDWEHFAWAVERMWSNHVGLSSLDDLPLTVQMLTSIALETNLWHDAGGTSEALYRAAVTHVYRVVASLNALAGRVGGSEFLAVPEQDERETSMSWNTSTVSKGAVDLGVLRYMISTTDSRFLVDVLGICGQELRQDVERLRLLAGLPELRVSEDVRKVLGAVDDRLLSLIDPHQAAVLGTSDFDQDRTSGFEHVARNIEYDLRGFSPIARRLPRLDPLRDDPQWTLF